MKRALYNELLHWKNNRFSKPLLLQGARQVGKTYLITQFGKNEFENLIYLNFEQDPNLKLIFEGTLEAKVVLENISLYLGQKINPDNTLLFFDEIQILPRALTSLKYFQEELPEYKIIAAGSLLGVSVGMHESFPVGKVNFLTLYPLSFEEFLNAFDEEMLAEKIAAKTEISPIPEVFHNKLLTLLKKYLFLGGMPEVLQSYLNTNDILLSRKIQNEILEAYQRDFSKYATNSEAVKLSELWRSIPSQLARENKKFKYKEIKIKARASLYEQTIEWLRKAGLINVAYNISVPKLPLSGYANFSKFKIYMLDSGLLGAMLKLSSEIILKPDDLFKEYNGAFIENFVASELRTKNSELFYWTSKSDAEVDFIIERKNKIYPLEIKSGKSKNIKSLRSYADKFNPKLLIRTSPRNYIKSDNFVNIPLYSVGVINKIIDANN